MPYRIHGMQPGKSFPWGTKFQEAGSSANLCIAFGRKILMMLDEQHSEELRALRNLERAVRAFSVTAHMLPVSRRQEILATALREVVEARKSAIRRARCVPFR